MLSAKEDMVGLRKDGEARRVSPKDFRAGRNSSGKGYESEKIFTKPN